ncbi:UPF0711 protein C18orf21 homolog [Pangshura tecta]
MAGRWRFLKGAARALTDTCPAEARFLMWSLHSEKGKFKQFSGFGSLNRSQAGTLNSQLSSCWEHVILTERSSFRGLLCYLYSSVDKKPNRERICPYCFQFLVPDNHRVRLKPKMKLTPRIQKLLNREAKNHKLNLKQTKLLKKYKDSRSVLLVTCNTCNKTTRHHGKSRDFLATATSRSGTPKSKPDPKIPISANKMTPFNHSKSGSISKSPTSASRTCMSGQSPSSSFSKSPKNTKFHFTQLKWLINLEEKQKSQKKMDLKNFLSSL